ncbi:MAG: hypothetical protein CMH52_11640 [Myxococcales bacterium]|nr:hypothetical protein [Myxococcales bacterium]|tara:strand:- start:511 stop:810 length:300 start_codon:yes stop_codon:yes gene_type:complete
MTASQRAKVLKPSRGLAGFLALLMPVVTQGNTVEFKSDGDTYHAEKNVGSENRGVVESVTANALSTLSPEKYSRATTAQSRYRERSRFDGRGAIVDLVT